LAQAAREEEDLRTADPEGFGQGQKSDGGGLAGLATTIEDEAFVAAFEDLDLPEIGIEAKLAHRFGAGGFFARGHGEPLGY